MPRVLTDSEQQVKFRFLITGLSSHTKEQLMGGFKITTSLFSGDCERETQRTRGFGFSHLRILMMLRTDRAMIGKLVDGPGTKVALPVVGGTKCRFSGCRGDEALEGSHCEAKGASCRHQHKPTAVVTGA